MYIILVGLWQLQRTRPERRASGHPASWLQLPTPPPFWRTIPLMPKPEHLAILKQALPARTTPVLPSRDRQGAVFGLPIYTRE